MEVFITRDASGYQTFDMEGVEDLDEVLKDDTERQPLSDNDEVHLTIDARWSEVKELLALPFFAEKGIWRRDTDVPDKLPG